MYLLQVDRMQQFNPLSFSFSGKLKDKVFLKKPRKHLHKQRGKTYWLVAPKEGPLGLKNL